MKGDKDKAEEVKSDTKDAQDETTAGDKKADGKKADKKQAKALPPKPRELFLPTGSRPEAG